jgi:hypothetical protein
MFRERLIRHPAWLVLIPAMHVSRRVSKQDRLLHQCLNITTPDDPSVLDRIYDLTASCVVCGDVIRPVTPDAEMDLAVRFTCNKESCLDDQEVRHLTDTIISMMAATHHPHQTHLF